MTINTRLGKLSAMRFEDRVIEDKADHMVEVYRMSLNLPLSKEILLSPTMSPTN